MQIKIYNTFTKSKEEFKPIIENQVGIYSCGPTVYNFVHIGNLRAYIFADILHRAFLYNGYKVKHVMNITDVDDKTIRDSQVAGMSLKDFTDQYTQAFFNDLKELNINIEEYIYPHATDNIEEMVDLIKELLDKGFAYKAEDGSIYFNISKFPNYGKLSGVDFERNIQQSRIVSDEYQKEDAHDFALWKAWDEKDGDVFWETDIGKGRPGWHIECSVMSEKNLGQPFDIHTGGIDLVFPHHENEIAQSEAANGKKFVNYWMHNEMLMVNGQKMSKSLGNVYSLKDIEKKVYPLVLRYLFLQTHYRQKQNFTWEALDAAKNGLGRLYSRVFELGSKEGIVSQEFKNRFINKINDDLNTSEALAISQELLKSNLSNEDKLATILDFDEILGFMLRENMESHFDESIVSPQEIIKLAEDRKVAKQEKKFELADSLRAKILELGYEVEDTKEGSIIKKKK